jgi:AraC-like DNA-binding protein/quercetin dioxygenase-like cupin family protein
MAKQLENESFLESGDFPFYAAPYVFVPNQQIGDHSHAFFELVYVAEGTGEHSYDNGEYHKLSIGDVFIIEPGIKHAYRVGPTGGFKVYNVLFTPSLLKAELDVMSSVTSFVNFFYMEPLLRNDVHFNTKLSLRPQQRLAFKEQLDGLTSELTEKKLGYRIFIKTLMIQLFVFLSRCYQENEVLKKAFVPDDRLMASMVEFIQRHFTQPLALEQISQICGMSTSAFATKFKRYTGRTFVECRNEIRMKAAGEMLLQTDRKISDIAQEVGFGDLSFFNLLFKKKNGISPGAFRKRYRNHV